MPQLVLNPNREGSLLRKHPWIYSGAVAKVVGEPQPGETVEIVSAKGEWLARGFYSPASQIRARVWTFERDEAVNETFFARRIQQAKSYRDKLRIQSNSYRLVHGEADGLPGCVVDVYGKFCVCQFLTTGIARFANVIASQLMALPGIEGVYERSDAEARTREGLELHCGPLAGKEPPERFIVEENGLRLIADLRNGHKTGFYLDQRDARSSMPFAKGADVLNCFCYTGGFGLRAAMEGANSVTQVDISAPALEIARENAALNSLGQDRFTYIKADVFVQLRKFRDQGRSFDVVILDPPKFADTQRQLQHAARGYKDINLLGAKLTRPGGTLLTFSCSGAMTPDLFAKVVGDACRDAGRKALVRRILQQAPDHPTALDFPEGRYLTGLELCLL